MYFGARIESSTYSLSCCSLEVSGHVHALAALPPVIEPSVPTWQGLWAATVPRVVPGRYDEPIYNYIARRRIEQFTALQLSLTSSFNGT
jgi:hypothetical protein